MPQPPKNLRDFSALRSITESLRGEQGCPWDKEQTHESLTRFAIEEAFELAEAIESQDKTAIIGELGDVLFQVLLHSEIAKQEGSFTLEDVMETLAEKMVRRHPHVFSDVKVKSSQEVLNNWQKIKDKERNGKRENALATPKGLPALADAMKIGEKTRSLGFDWSNSQAVVEKVQEEMREFLETVGKNDAKATEHEIGDVLFSVAQLARHQGVDPEQALRKTNARFRRRFQSMVDSANGSVEKFSQLPAEQKERLWAKAKSEE